MDNNAIISIAIGGRLASLNDYIQAARCVHRGCQHTHILPAPQLAMERPGALIFKDVLRRADKYDDGVLAPEEFFAFFNDEVRRRCPPHCACRCTDPTLCSLPPLLQCMSFRDLRGVFHSMDRDGSGYIDIGELAECVHRARRWTLGVCLCSRPVPTIEQLLHGGRRAVYALVCRA